MFIKIALAVSFSLLLASIPFNASAASLKIVKVTDSVYTLVGPLGNRDKSNLGNNANFGIVLSKNGVILIDSGASYKGAKAIHKTIQSITKKPIRLVINSGGQDHRWLGNDYFKKLGATIIASNNAVTDHKARFQSQYNGLSRLIGDKNLAGTEAVFANQTFDSKLKLDHDGVKLELYHNGPAHTPGDSFVWLPKQKVVFTGDIVYTERMLGISPHSNSKSWLKVFESVAALKPLHVIPGHGNPTTLNVATKDTYNYIKFLRTSITELIDASVGIENVGRLNQEQFSYLKNYDALKGRNAQRVYEEIEFE